MSRRHWFGAEKDGGAEYASTDDFRQFFESEAAALMGLAVILTAEPDKARSCFLQARTDCIANGSVVRDFKSSWARRRIIVNAIEILNHNDPVSAIHAEHASESQGIESDLQCCLQSRQPLPAISALTDFERLSYVICVHEEYSLYECALLLNSSPTAVDEALGIKRRDLGGQSVSTVSLPYSQEEVVERFLLTPAELQLAFAWRGETNRCGIALTTPQIDAIIPRFDRRFIGSYRSFPCVTPFRNERVRSTD